MNELDVRIETSSINLVYHLLRCPRCNSKPIVLENNIECSSCGSTYRLLYGIFPYLIKDENTLSASEQVEIDNLQSQVNKIHRKDWREDYNIERINVVEELLPEGIILDIGAADGQIAHHLTNYKRIVIAMEKTPHWLKVHGNAFVPFVFSDIYCIPFEEDSFDGIFMGEIIEHLYDPLEAVRRAIKYLKKGGKLVGTVPNFYFYRKRLHYLCGNFGEEPDNPLKHEHIRQFSYRILLQMLRDAGFCDIKIKAVWQRNIFPFLCLPSAIAKPIQSLLAKLYPSLFAVNFVFSGKKP
jgi:SAM-dependent methyltransferase